VVEVEEENCHQFLIKSYLSEGIIDVELMRLLI